MYCGTYAHGEVYISVRYDYHANMKTFKYINLHSHLLCMSHSLEIMYSKYNPPGLDRSPLRFSS